jgi:hypothetical protein
MRVSFIILNRNPLYARINKVTALRRELSLKRFAQIDSQTPAEQGKLKGVLPKDE